MKEIISPEQSSPRADAPLSMADRKGQLEAQRGDDTDLENLSKEELVEKSWDFLTHITEKVSLLPETTQQKILDIGRQLAKSGAAYGHTVPDRREFLRKAQKTSHDQM